MKITMAGNDESRDGRLSVLLCLIICLLLYDFSIEYNWFSSIGYKGTKREKHMKVSQSGLVIIAEPVMPTRTEETTNIPVAFTPFFFKPIPINIATKEMLMTVKGIGPSLAENIVDQRRKSGPFKNPEDLLALKGIGRKRVSYFKNVFTFKELH